MSAVLVVFLNYLLMDLSDRWLASRRPPAPVNKFSQL
jgi:hypothetical protein